MGNLNYIVFGGVDSRDYGIYISGEGVFNAPERDVEVVNIPGKDGDLLIDRGRFLNIQVTYPGFNFEPGLSTFAERLRAFRAALTSQIGYQRLEDSFHPDEFRLASFRSGLDVNPVMYNTASTFDIVFDCKPQRFLKSGEEEITIGEWGETETVSGSIATFEAEANTGIKSLVANIEPIQDLNGQSNPYPAGGGKNLLNLENLNTAIAGVTIKGDSLGRLELTGTRDSSTGWKIFLTKTITEAGTYTMSLNNNKVTFLKGYRQIISGSTLKDTITLAVGDVIRCALNVTNGTVLNDSNVEMQLEKGSTATPYAPYSNICPISGWSGVNVNRTGINVWDEEWELGGIRWSTGETYADNNLIRNKGYISIKPNADYFATSGISAIYFYNENKAHISTVDRGTGTFTAPSNAKYLRFAFVSSYGTTYKNDTAINHPSTATAYEPYQGETITKSLGRTVYGGTLDLASGVLKSYPYYSSYSGQTLRGEWICDRAVYSQGTTPPTGSQVVDMGGTPTTYQLTAEQISTILGVNNIWADTGEVSVEYGADPNILVNPTPFEALPLIEVVGVGSLTVGNTTVTITGDSTQDIFIDSDIMEAYENDNGAIISRNDRISLSGMHFPTLGTDTGITYTGLTSVTVTPRWWTI